MEWIEVKNDVPEYGEMVLVYLGTKGVYCGVLKESAKYRKKDGLTHHWSFYSLGKRHEINTNNADFVTHWMELPEPPKQN